jgi:hypothetical protein
MYPPLRLRDQAESAVRISGEKCRETGGTNFCSLTRERAFVPYRQSDGGDDILREQWSQKTWSWAAI